MRPFVAITLAFAGWVGVVFAGILVITTLGGDGDEPQATDGQVANQTVAIVTPEDGASVDAGDIVITVAVGGFEIVDKLGDDAVDGEGHLIFYLDVDEMPTMPGQEALIEDARSSHAAASTSYTWKFVRPGTHSFGVQLVNNDHTPLEPPVLDDVEVTVE
ncbi:MAG TPA: DUF4399 domain-containing protein [Dehalococcoidia bacterium]|nr:DUF4399 domain-containing protein [Dehalococcoidia bacterium]